MTRMTRIFVHRLVSIKSLCCVLLFLSMSMNLCLAQTFEPEYIPGVLMVKFKDETALSATKDATIASVQEQVLQAVPSLANLDPVWKAAYSQVAWTTPILICAISSGQIPVRSPTMALTTTAMAM